MAIDYIRCHPDRIRVLSLCGVIIIAGTLIHYLPDGSTPLSNCGHPAAYGNTMSVIILHHGSSSEVEPRKDPEKRLGICLSTAILHHRHDFVGISHATASLL